MLLSKIYRLLYEFKVQFLPDKLLFSWKPLFILSSWQVGMLYKCQAFDFSFLQNIQKFIGDETLQKLINFALGYMSKLVLPCKRWVFLSFLPWSYDMNSLVMCVEIPHTLYDSTIITQYLISSKKQICTNSQKSNLMVKVVKCIVISFEGGNNVK